MAPSSSRLLLAASRAEDESYSLPPFSSNPEDAEIVCLLHPLTKRYQSDGRTGVNGGLPLLDPWDIPGMPLEEVGANRREKYYVTDCSGLKSTRTNPSTQTGYWKPRDQLDWGWGIPATFIGPLRFAGLKTTYDFYVGDTIHEEGSKETNWIMDVYCGIDQTNGQIEDDLILCHVFKGITREYNPRPRCAAHHHELPKEKEVIAQTNNGLLERPAGLLETHISSNKHVSPPDHVPQLGSVSQHQISEENGSLAAHHQGWFQLPNHSYNQNAGETNHQAIGQSNDRFDLTDVGILPTDRSFLPLSPTIAIMVDVLANNIENTGVEASDSMEIVENGMPNGVSSAVSASAENGPLGKRPRTKSPVWGKFTKLLTKAKAALAVCNHCCKVMSGESSNGTSHLRRHKCGCCNH